jgi:hypothetical protein
VKTTLWFPACILSAVLCGCGDEPTTFVVVEASGQLSSNLPSPVVVPAPEVIGDAEGCDAATITTAATVPVVRRAWDAVHFDGLAVDEVVSELFAIDQKGQPFSVCSGEESRAGDALLCDPNAGVSTLLSPTDQALICAEGWASCQDALSTSYLAYYYPIYPIDARFLPPLTPEQAAVCACPNRALETFEAAQYDLYISLYNQLYANPTVRLDNYLALQGDASLTVRNAAPGWTVADPSPEANAGVCGVWVFGDDDFATLSAPGEDGAPSTLEQVCGGVGVPDICPEGGCEDPQPLTALRADVLVGRGSVRQSYLLGGVGDMSGAFQLPPADAQARRCPTCEGTSCELIAGAVGMMFGRDLRYRVEDQEGPLHVLAAECPHPRDFAGSGWQRACWHTEVPREALAAGRHLVIDIGGITDAVSRPTDELELETETEP